MIVVSQGMMTTGWHNFLVYFVEEEEREEEEKEEQEVGRKGGKD